MSVICKLAHFLENYQVSKLYNLNKFKIPTIALICKECF